MKERLTYYALSLLCITTVAFTAQQSPGAADVRPLHSDASGIVLEYRPQYLPHSSVFYDGKEYYNALFEGAIPVSSLPPGSPLQYYRSVLVNLPGTKNNAVEIINVGYEDISNVLLPPVPEYIENEISVSPKYFLDEKEYSNTKYLPEQIAVLTDVGETRGIVLGSLRLFPYQYMAGLRKLRKYNVIVVRIHFGSSEQTSKHPDELTKNLAINARSLSVHESPKQTAIATYSNSVLAAGEWFKFPVTEEGMYKFTGRMLLDAGIPSSVNPRTIKIYGNGGYELPLSPTASAPDDLIENAIYTFDAGNNSRLDDNDYIIFFAKSTRGWSYNPSSKSFSHYLNHFTETNYYWLTYGGNNARQMDSVVFSFLPTYRPTTIEAKVFREDEKINILNSGLEWVGQSLNDRGSFTYVHSLPGLDNTQPIRYRIRLGARSNSFSTYTIYEHETPLANVGIASTVVGSYYYSQYQNTIFDRTFMPALDNNQSRLKFTYSTSSAGGVGYIDWYEIFYQRFLSAENDVFEFDTKDTTATAEYSVRGFSSNHINVFDVTRFDSAYRVGGITATANTCTFRYGLQAGAVRRIVVVGERGYKTPSPLSRVPNQNLHGDTTQVDYIIITHSEFLPAAQRLKAHRERAGAEMLRTRIVDVERIYNEFGGGLQSPLAIRNYLKYVYNNQAVAPKYALLLGDGDFDYKRIIATGPNWIPPFETPESFDPLRTYATEDEFASFTDSRRMQMAIGRLCVRSLSEANGVVDKIIEYETRGVNTPWKIRVTLVADDGLEGEGRNNEFIHTNQAEAISQLVPSLFELQKVYLYQYPTVYTSTGRRKPAANQDILRQINEGTLVLNFTGHGNPRLWTHEQVFVRETDFPQLRNANKYFFVVAATCNFSQFDMLSEQSGGEVLVSMPNAGAIASFSATRPSFSFENFTLNQSLYQNLFQVDAEGRILPQRLGDVLYRVKQDNMSDNDRKYFLIGDPALRFAFPKVFFRIDSINHQAASQTISLGALQRVQLKATLNDTTPNNAGTASVVVYDSDKRIEIEDFVRRGENIVRITSSFIARGDVLFSGDNSVRNGALVSTFIVPKDISYSNNNGRITLYFWNDATDGAGYARNIRIGGTDTTAPPDNLGPQLQLYLDSRGFRTGDVVGETPTLIVDLFDSSGINTSSAGIGHRIEGWLDNSSQSIDLTNYYKSKIDTYQEGTIEYPLTGLSYGSHRIRVRAWDTYNNASTTETIFDVVTSVGLQVFNVHNYPNPFSQQTIFTFEHNQLSAVDAEVKIYTVAGRLIQTIRRNAIAENVGKILWDGRDSDGDVLANGVYLYKLIIRTSDGRFSNETIGKLSVVK